MFEYGKLGELTQNIHTFVMPGTDELYTFTTKWEYDSWNRIKTITYPDGEKLIYNYNNAGMLTSMIGKKGGNNYEYILDIQYNKFEKRDKIAFGNQTYSEYTYNPLNLQLSNLKTYDINNNLLQDIDYSYDAVSNITKINNNAATVNNLGGAYNYTYSYDQNYRLINSQGVFNENGNNRNFYLDMQYTPSGNIAIKYQKMNNGINPFNYNREYHYGGNKPHCPEEIIDLNGEMTYIEIKWDDNGNILSYCSKYKEAGGMRRHCWDDENRLNSVVDDKYLSVYAYDAAGERVWKQTGPIIFMQINNNTTIKGATIENNTLYASPLMVADNKAYTKHYYVEGQRICSKIGGGFKYVDNPTENPINPPIEMQLFDENRYKSLCIKSECAEIRCGYINYVGGLGSITEYVYDDRTENDLYFYHPDHLGSSSFITDNGGTPIQHLQYLPYGESFINQRVIGYDARYTFSGKEKDAETDYSYFGARYYNSDISLWLSMYPIAKKKKAFQFSNYQQNSVSPKKRRAGVGCECKKRRKSKKAFTFGACPTTFLDFQVFCRAGRSIVFS